MDEIEGLLRREGVVTLATIEDASNAVPLAQALASGGLNVIEVALRTPESMQAIREIAASSVSMRVLAGTVLTIEQANEALECGATGLVSPGFSPQLSRWALERDVAYVPGVATPSEIMSALDHGHTALKFFPASHLGGLSALGALCAPFSHRGISFMMTGGMTSDDVRGALSASYVSAVGGSWIAPKELLALGDWDGIAENARAARALVIDARGEQVSP